ncbi:MAG: hypothetical protein JWP25_1707 [Bradyrhizobium sp.]|jgi:hypothetical protein|nr:hypothetical protein [Bradyrhizobium sp.]
MESVTDAPGKFANNCHAQMVWSGYPVDAADIASFSLLFIVKAISPKSDRFPQGVGSIVGAPVYVTPTVAWASAVVLNRGNVDERE